MYIGIIEQNSPEDKFCLEVYCNYYNSIVYQRQTVRDKLIKVLAKPSGYSTCPFYQNIRLLSMQDTQARGPMYARSFTRKLLANEEYCLQIDAHTTFLSNWDTIAKEEWLMASNEFGIVTTVPPPVSEQEKYTTGGEFEFTVPRQCSIQFRDNGFPVSFSTFCFRYLYGPQSPHLHCRNFCRFTQLFVSFFYVSFPVLFIVVSFFRNKWY